MPTRGRPQGAREAVDSFLETRRIPSTSITVVLDEGDPRKDDYYGAFVDLPLIDVAACAGDMIQRTNMAALWVVDEADIIGWMADDNRFRTVGWDERVQEAMADPRIGFVNLNDLFWSERFPSDKPVNTYVRSSIVRALGWYANPGQTHHYMDDTWRMLGVSTDSMLYLRDVICEHMHPSLGKGEWDDGYRYTESDPVNAAELASYMKWLWESFREDRAKVKTCLG